MLPLKIWTDGDARKQPDNTSRLNINTNVDLEKGSITNEEGFTKNTSYPKTSTTTGVLSVSTPICIGKIPITNGAVVIFNYVSGYSEPNTGPVASKIVTSEIGVLSAEGNYRVVVRDEGYDSSAPVVTFNFDPDFPIEGTYRINPDGTINVYWVDGKNPYRWLNIDTPQVAMFNANNQITDPAQLDKTLVFKIFTQPKVLLESVDNDGNLPSGVIYPVIAYLDETYNPTSYSSISNPVSIVPPIPRQPFWQYDGAEPKTPTSKSFTIKIESTELDTTYKYVRVAIITKIGGVLSQYLVGDFPISSGADFTCKISTLDNLASLSLEEILIGNPSYIPQTTTTLDDVNYIGNLKTAEMPDLQPYINGIIVDVIPTSAPPPPAILPRLNVEGYSNDYRREITIYDNKSFMWGEVYALYVSVFIDGIESKLYHIPGRPPVVIALPLDPVGTFDIGEDSLISSITGPDYNFYTYNGGGVGDTSPGGEMYNIDNNSKIFHAFDTGYNANAIDFWGYASNDTNMGFWENETELYPNIPNWNVVASNGEVVDSLQGLKVRHHKFPDPQNCYNTINYNEVTLAGIKLKNIQLPAAFSNRIDRMNVYYAKRTFNNRLILAESIMIPQHISYDLPGVFPPVGSPPVPNIEMFPYSLGANMVIETQSSGLTSGNFTITPRTKVTTAYPGSGGVSWWRMSPFDMMINTTDSSSVRYVKTFGGFAALYRFVYEFPTPVTYNSGTGGLSFELSYDTFTPAFVVTNPDSRIRRIHKTQLMETNPTVENGANIYASTAPGFSTGNIVNYKGNLSVIIELVNGIDMAEFPSAHYFGANRNDPTYFPTFTTPHSALYQYKSDIYLDFANQEVCFVGTNIKILSAAFNGAIIIAGQNAIENIYGGDTFTAYYGYRETTDLAIVFNLGLGGGSTPNQLCIYKHLHYFITQSNANPSFRHQGTGQYDIYFPHETAYNVLKQPLIPNGNSNYYGYNSDYSAINDIKQPAISPLNPLPQQFDFPTRVARSAKNNPESITDNLRIYSANDYIDLEKSKGAITALRVQNAEILIHFENTLKKTMGRQRILTSGTEGYLGAGDIFDVIPRDILNANTSYGGCISQWASVVTPYGYFFPDINTGKIFQYTEGIVPITQGSIENFFRENLKINAVSNLIALTFSTTPAWVYNTNIVIGDVRVWNNSIWRCTTSIIPSTTPPYISSGVDTSWELLYSYDNCPIIGKDGLYLGYIATFDNKYKRYILSKKDVTFTSAFTGVDPASVPGSPVFRGEFNDTYAKQTESPPNPYTVNSIVIKNGILYLYSSTSGSGKVIISEPEDPYIAYGTKLYFNNTTYFTPKRWTIAYYPEVKGFVSWYTYYPDNFITNNNEVYSTVGSELFRQNQNNQLTRFYGYFPEETIIEPIFNQQPEKIKKLLSIEYETKAFNIDNNNLVPTEDYLTTFDTYQAYDSFQLSKETDIVNQVNARNVEGTWRVNDLRDYTTSNSTSLFSDITWNKPFNSLNINLSKHWASLKRLVDYWFGVRFKWKNRKSKVITFTILNSKLSTRTNDTTGVLTIISATGISAKDVILVTMGGIVYTFYVTLVSINSYTIILESGVLPINNTPITAVSKIIPIKLNLIDITSNFIKNDR